DDLKKELFCTQQWGIEITSVDLQELNIPDEIIRATEKLMTQQKEAESHKKAEIARRELELCKHESQLQIQAQELIAEMEQTKAQAERNCLVAKSRAEAQRIQAKADQETVNLLFQRNPERIPE